MELVALALGVAVFIGVVGYRDAAAFRRDHGVDPWGIPAPAWGLLAAYSLLIGALLLGLAKRRTLSRSATHPQPQPLSQRPPPPPPPPAPRPQRTGPEPALAIPPAPPATPARRFRPIVAIGLPLMLILVPLAGRSVMGATEGARSTNSERARGVEQPSPEQTWQGTSPDPSNPAGAVAAFMVAARDNCAAVETFMTPESASKLVELFLLDGLTEREALPEFCRAVSEGVEHAPLYAETIWSDGEQAEVALTVGTVSQPTYYLVVARDGGWLVDLVPSLESAQAAVADGQVQSDLRNGLTAQKVVHADEGRFTSDLALLSAIEPNLEYASGVATEASRPFVVHVEVGLDGAAVCISALSETGTLFMIKDIVRGGLLGGARSVATRDSSGTTYRGGSSIPGVCDAKPLDESWDHTNDIETA